MKTPAKTPSRREVCVIGTGYVGLVTGACLAELGHRVSCVDSDRRKIAVLNSGRLPIYEPGLQEIVVRNKRAGRLCFVSSIPQGLRSRGRAAEVVFIAVGTPPRPDGSADLSAVESVAREVARHLRSYTVIVDKSTVPVETGEWVSKTIQRFNRSGVAYDVASNPEFLSEGTAIRDFMEPDRIVLGVPTRRAEEVLRSVYAGLEAPVIVTDVKSAELIKHASNSFLATKISFINAISVLCEKTGADVEQVSRGMGLDRRIGPRFLRAGLGFGGFCLDGDEPVVLRDPAGIVRVTALRDAFDALRPGAGRWEALSLDTGTGRVAFMPVAGIGRRLYRGVMVRVKTKMGRSVRMTADHPVVVREGGGWIVKPACQLAPGDRLPCFLSIPSSATPFEIDLIEAVRARRPEFHAGVLVRARRGGPWILSARSRKELARLTGRNHSRIYDVLKRGNPLTLGEFTALESSGSLRVPHRELALATAKDAATYVPAVIGLTPEFCRFLGYAAAETCLTAEHGLRGVRERLSIHFHEDEADLIADVRSLLERLGIKHMVLPGRRHRTTRITVSSRLLAFLVRDILGCGTDSYCARVPPAVLTSSPELRREYLVGALRGDGSAWFHKGTPAGTLELATVSPGMAHGATALLHSLGIVPSTRRALLSKSAVPANILRVSGAPQVRLLAYAKGSGARGRILRRLASLLREPAPSGFRRETAESATVRVTGVLREDFDGPVYSLEVPGTETFALATGLIVHNCFPKDLEAFRWIARQKGYDFKLLDAVREINEEQKGWVLRKLEEELWNLEGKTVAVLGLSFKPHTDDMRFAPSLDVIGRLLERRVHVRAFDPVAIPKARSLLPRARFAKDPYEAAHGADALVIVTEWPEFAQLDLGRLRRGMKTPILLDGRNIYDPAKARAAGFTYRGVGRP